MNRREFLFGASGVCLAAGISRYSIAATTDSGLPSVTRMAADKRNRTPYRGIDWTKAQLVNTTSHGHAPGRPFLEPYKRRNFGLYTISNYWPSAPTMPGKSIRERHYFVHHDWPLIVNGKRTAGPFEWNEILKGWKDTLPEAQRKQLPFREAGLMFPNWPDGVLEAPNAEHHWYTYDDGKMHQELHVCAPGSDFRSGTFDAGLRFKVQEHGYACGSGEYWRVGFDRLIEGLVVPDGGGITINHPTWSHHRREQVAEFLDHDARVLGIEVLEDGVNSENYWDWILSTGRQCFGFFVPDWGASRLLDEKKDGPDVVFGVNVLVVPERTVEACLRAYRQGNFYGAASGLGALRFTKIDFGEKKIVVETDKKAKLEVITARGVVKTVTGTRIEWDVPKETWGCGWDGAILDVFCRVKAYALDGSKEVLFTQPYMLKCGAWRA